MASALVVTAGDGSANCYSSLAFANQYHENRLHAATWTDADEGTRNAALLMATRVQNQQFLWAGVRTYPSTQALDFPRDGLMNANGDGALDPTTIPVELQISTAEFARLLIETDTTVASGIAGGAITSLKAGSVKIDYAEGVVAHTDLVPDSVRFSVPRHWWVSIRSRQPSTLQILRA